MKLSLFSSNFMDLVARCQDKSQIRQLSRVKMFSWKVTSIIFFLILHTFVESFDDPYEVLGISRSASVTEIKSAFKKLAKEWHPDKNKNANAEEKFIEVNKAYQLLIDPERREEFDRHSTTEDKPNFRNRPDYGEFGRFHPFESSFSENGFHFKFSSSGSVYHKHTITSKAYYNNVLEGSLFKPYLVMFYSGFCIPCMQTEPIWQRVIDEFELIGISVVCINAEHEHALAKKLSISSVPYLLGVIDGRVKHYREHRFSLSNTIKFTKNLFPAKTINRIRSSEELKHLLSGWNQDNKIRVMIFCQLESIRLRYFAAAFKYRTRAVFIYIQLGSKETKFVTNIYRIPMQHTESLFIFHEDSVTPVASLTMPELSTQAMNDVIEANKFLLLPRLSSQQVFNTLCPPEASGFRKILCIVLVTHNTPAHDEYKDTLRDYLHSHHYNKDRVRFLYIFEEKQTDFVGALMEGKRSQDAPSSLPIVLLWRKDSKHVKYQWLTEGWNITPQKINSSREALESTIKHLLKQSDALPYKAVVAELVDEHAMNIFSRIANKVLLFVDSMQEKFTKEQALPAISIILTAGFIILVGFGMSYLVKIEEEAIKQKYGERFKNNGGAKPKPVLPSLKIHELRGETYNGLLRLLKPGCRTLILLVDNESKSVLVTKFFKCVFPYRKNKSLMFAFLNLDRNLDWFRGLLIQALTTPRELNINPKNCIGTVVSVNGHRKYFCMYHAKHTEPTRNGKLAQNGGGFMGFDNSEPESENSDIECGKISDKLINEDEHYSKVLFQENLLDKLQEWLDRLFDGSTLHYRFQIWPSLSSVAPNSCDS